MRIRSLWIWLRRCRGLMIINQRHPVRILVIHMSMRWIDSKRCSSQPPQEPRLIQVLGARWVPQLLVASIPTHSPTSTTWTSQILSRCNNLRKPSRSNRLRSQEWHKTARFGVWRLKTKRRILRWWPCLIQISPARSLKEKCSKSWLKQIWIRLSAPRSGICQIRSGILLLRRQCSSLPCTWCIKSDKIQTCNFRTRSLSSFQSQLVRVINQQLRHNSQVLVGSTLVSLTSHRWRLNLRSRRCPLPSMPIVLTAMWASAPPATSAKATPSNSI